AAELEAGFDLRALGRADAFDCGHLRGLRVIDAFEVVKITKELTGAVQRALAGVAGAQQNRDQLRVREILSAPLKQLFAWPVLLRPLLDRLVFLGHEQGIYHAGPIYSRTRSKRPFRYSPSG